MVGNVYFKTVECAAGFGIGKASERRLKSFVNMEKILVPGTGLGSGETQLMWKVIIHVVLVISGVLFAVMDRVAEPKDGHH